MDASSSLMGGPASADAPTDGEHRMGTTIVGVCYDGGVVLAADSRTSTGMYVANRASDKISQLTDNVYVCRSGSVEHPYLRRQKSTMAGSCGMFPSPGVVFFGIKRRVKALRFTGNSPAAIGKFTVGEMCQTQVHSEFQTN